MEDNSNKFKEFQGKFKKFIYRSYSWKWVGRKLVAKFHFEVDDQFLFQPFFELDFNQNELVENDSRQIDWMVFNIGMVELISYWKAMVPKIIDVIPFQLNSQQIEFWKKLYFNGLGEFFYLNNIKTSYEEFTAIQSSGPFPLLSKSFSCADTKILVPVGGGKDSAVTIELLKSEYTLIPFVINPRRATDESIIAAGLDAAQSITINRKIDPRLLDLNRNGYLNGHTPFSSLVAFTSLLTAEMIGIQSIALSNESSANEPTVSDGANHQYSKSVEFESDFRKYVKSYLHEDIEYFSLLRPLSEIQIASLFSQYPHHFESFKSCNVGSKTDTWCGNCSKCLFTFIILSPFLQKDELISIFDKNLFDDKLLIPVLDELTGIAPVKPFECVGTVNEVKVAMLNIDPSWGQSNSILLEYFKKHRFDNSINALESYLKFKPGNEKHFLESQFLDILSKAFDEN